MSASNETPRNRKVLTALARDILAGMVSLQDSIGLHHHRDTTLRPLILNLAGEPAADPLSNANKGSQLVYKESSEAVTVANEAVGALSNGAVKNWLATYRRVTETIHGPKFNGGWEAAGFTFDGTSVPRKPEERQDLLASARAYLTAHPTYEATLPQQSGPPLAITAAQALVLHGQLNTALALVNDRESTETTCKEARDADVDALYGEVSATITELGDVLEDDDPRWEQMGLNIPANANPPEGITSLTVISGGNGREIADWPKARRATYYRAFIKVAGVDTDFRFVDRTEDLDFVFRDLTPGATVSIQIIPANSGGEGPPSPTVTKVVGA